MANEMAMVDTLKSIFKVSKGKCGKGRPEFGEIRDAGRFGLPILEHWFPQGYKIQFHSGIGRVGRSSYYSFVPAGLGDCSGTRARVYLTMICVNAAQSPKEMVVRIALTQGGQSKDRLSLRKLLLAKLAKFAKQEGLGDIFPDESSLDICYMDYLLSDPATNDAVLKHQLEKLMSHMNAFLAAV